MTEKDMEIQALRREIASLKSVSERPPRTNFESIKAMSLEVLALNFRFHSICDFIQNKHSALCFSRESCDGCVENWLEMEVDNG